MKLARLIEYKRTLTLAALLLLSALLYIVNGAQSRGIQSLREAALDAYAPALRASDWLRRQAGKPFAALVSYNELKRENEVLKMQIAQLQVRYDALSEAHQTLRRLAQWDFGDMSGEAGRALAERCVPARIIGMHRSAAAHTATLDKGSRDGIVDNAPAVAPEGLVGVVRQTVDRSSTVQILSDPNCSITVEIEGTRERGLIRGTGKADRVELLLESPSPGRIAEGQRVKTAGVTGSAYPAGLLVGSIASVRRDKFGNTIADVEPAADLSQLGRDAVLVLPGVSEVDRQASSEPSQ